MSTKNEPHLEQSDKTARWAFKRGFEFALWALGQGVTLDDMRQYWPALHKWRMATVGRPGLADYPNIDTSPKLPLYERFVTLWETQEGLNSDDALWVEMIRSALSEPDFAMRIFGTQLTNELLAYLERPGRPGAAP